MGAYHCAWLWYTVHHTTVLIMSVGRREHWRCMYLSFRKQNFWCWMDIIFSTSATNVERLNWSRQPQCQQCLHDAVHGTWNHCGFDCRVMWLLFSLLLSDFVGAVCGDVSWGHCGGNKRQQNVVWTVYSVILHTLFMAALCNTAEHAIYFALWFLSSIFFFFVT